jgi:hypothetical protein
LIAAIACLLGLFKKSAVVQWAASQARFIVTERTARSQGSSTRAPARHGEGQVSTIRCPCTVGCVLSVQVKEV